MTLETSKLEFFVILFNGLHLLVNVTEDSIIDVAGVKPLFTPLNKVLSVGMLVSMLTLSRCLPSKFILAVCIRIIIVLVFQFKIK